MINKSKNANLQLTINKKAYERLLNIQADINNKNGFELSKSQVIEYLINKYQLNGLTETNANRENAERDREIYMRKIRALPSKKQEANAKMRGIRHGYPYGIIRLRFPSQSPPKGRPAQHRSYRAPGGDGTLPQPPGSGLQEWP